MTDQHDQVIPYWQTAPELPPEIFTALRKANRAINPVAIVATLDPDGCPHTAPFGSLRATTPKRLRMCCFRHHDTLANITRDGRVMAAVVWPPNVAVSIRGRARVTKDQMDCDENYAILEIDIEEVKNDMVRAGTIEGGIVFTPLAELKDWFDTALAELETT
jgi:hypothetical protein